MTNLCLRCFHHMDGCWQDEDLPHIGIFEKKDFRHFAKRQ